MLEYSEFPNLNKFIRQQMKSNKKIDETLIATILNQLLDIVAYLHEKGCCHRDIKPENILFNEITGEVKLIDFEIAKMPKYEHQILEMMTSTGTLHYRAP